MCKDDYVSLEVAQLLKEKGFDWECRAYYVKSKECGIELFPTERSHNYNDDVYPRTSAPTLQMAMKWLREKGVIITIAYTMYSLHIIGSQMMFGFKVQNVQGELLLENSEVAYNSYEQAEMNAIKYSLENLVL